MKKILFSFAFTILLSSFSFAQDQNKQTKHQDSSVIINDITACVLRSNLGQEDDCYQEYISSRLEIADITGNWLFLDEQGSKINAVNPYQIVPHDTDVDPNKSFGSPGSCSILMIVKKQNAVQTKLCAPPLEDESTVPSINTIAKFTYKIVEAGTIELAQNVRNNYTTASCSLLWIAGTDYLICKAIEEEVNIKSVATFKKST